MWSKDILNNIKGFRFNQHEFAGALGDMGTFIPILVGMVTVCGLNAGSDMFVMLLTAAVIIAFHSTAIGFIVGLTIAYLFLYSIVKIEKLDKGTE